MNFVHHDSPRRSEPNDGRRDVARAIAELEEHLPPRLAPLARIAYDYACIWNGDAAGLFHDIDPAMWERCECNPRALIEAVPRHRLWALSADDGFVERVEAMAAALARPVEHPLGTWNRRLWPAKRRGSARNGGETGREMRCDARPKLGSRRGRKGRSRHARGGGVGV